MNVVLDDQFIKRVLVSKIPSWLIDLVDDGEIFTTPRWKQRIINSLQNPGNGMLSRDVVRSDIPELLQRLNQIALTPAIARELPESVGELAALQPLWREAIVGAVVTSSVLVVAPNQVSDRNRPRITAALTLLRVELVIKEP
jgi:hypothetical protein